MTEDEKRRRDFYDRLLETKNEQERWELINRHLKEEDARFWRSLKQGIRRLPLTIAEACVSIEMMHVAACYVIVRGLHLWTGDQGFVRIWWSCTVMLTLVMWGFALAFKTGGRLMDLLAANAGLWAGISIAAYIAMASGLVPL